MNFLTKNKVDFQKLPVPKKKHIKLISSLLEDANKYENNGDTETANKILLIIRDNINKYVNYKVPVGFEK